MNDSSSRLAIPKVNNNEMRGIGMTPQLLNVQQQQQTTTLKNKSKSFDIGGKFFQDPNVVLDNNKYNTMNSSSSKLMFKSLSNNKMIEENSNPTLKYYEQWYEYDKKRKELNYNIQTSIKLLESKFSFEREKGLDNLIYLLSNEIITNIDKDMFSLIHKKVDKHSNIIIAITTNILQNASIISPVTVNEVYKSLIVIEGCCLLSPFCSSTLTTTHGMKIILKILSEGKNYFNENQQDEMWDEVRMSCLDTLQSCLHNCSHNILVFCEDSSGPDVITTMLRNRVLSKLLRSKCVEFFCILFRFLSSIKELEEIHFTRLTERIKVFLGNKLTKDLIDIWKVNEDELDVTKCDQFVELIDERLIM
ncbi:hypothetical protein ABK040_016735 [Willaertia magna]